MTRISKNSAVDIEDQNTKQVKLVAGRKVKKYWRSLCDLLDPALAEVDLVTQRGVGWTKMTWRRSKGNALNSEVGLRVNVWIGGSMGHKMTFNSQSMGRIFKCIIG